MIADAIAAACSDPDVLAHLGGPLGDAARAKAAELRRVPDPQRKQARALAAALVRAPLLTGLRGIHPTWIEAALDELPPRARADLANPSFDPASVWLVRWVAASLAPMPAADLTRPRSIHDVARMSGDAIIAWLARVGADQLAFAAGAPSRYVGADVVTRIAQAPRAGKLGQRRAAIARCKVELDDNALVTIGARTLAPHTDAFVRRQLALRLPRTRGLAILFELERSAGDAIEASPAWDALAAD